MIKRVSPSKALLKARPSWKWPLLGGHTVAIVLYILHREVIYIFLHGVEWIITVQEIKGQKNED